MNRELIKELRAYCLELKEEEQIAKKLQKDRPGFSGYFLGLETAMMLARIKIETLLEQQPTSTAFSPPSRSVVIDSLAMEVNLSSSLVGRFCSPVDDVETSSIEGDNSSQAVDI